MKKIKIPISQSVTGSIDLSNLGEDDIAEIDGKRAIVFPTIDFAKSSQELESARENGAQIVYGTTTIEQKLENFLLLYFFGPFVQPDERRDFFVHNVLQSSGITYSFKKDLTNKIINEYNLLPGKDKNELAKQLKMIMQWRNAFAHGRLQHDSKLGPQIVFFSGSSQHIELNNEYWSKVENCFEKAADLLKTAYGKLCTAYTKTIKDKLT